MTLYGPTGDWWSTDDGSVHPSIAYPGKYFCELRCKGAAIFVYGVVDDFGNVVATSEPTVILKEYT